MPKVIVGRHVNGITINDLEFILDSKGNAMEFDSKTKAMKYLKTFGYTKGDMEALSFLDAEAYK